MSFYLKKYLLVSHYFCRMCCCLPNQN